MTIAKANKKPGEDKKVEHAEIVAGD